MARPRRTDKDLVVKARYVVAHTTEVDPLRAAQAVLLPALASATLEQTAAILGVGRATVPRLQQRFRESVQPKATRPRWGGRRKALLSVEQEAEFLAPWAEQVKEAGLAGPLPDPGGAGATLGPTGGRLGGLTAVGPAWVAQGGPGHAPPQERSRGARSVEKNSLKCWLPR